jgi:hypothetical protein
MAEDMSHEDDLLSVLRDLSERDPSPAIRQHLSNLCSQRLRQKRVIPELQRGTLVWRRAAFAAAFLVVLGLAAAAAVHFRYRSGAPAAKAPTAVSVPTSTEQSVSASSSTPPQHVSQLPKHRHFAQKPPSPLSPREMVVRLPYSNNSVDTGTGATIRVSMSQSELLSLGFPLNATLQDRRVVAHMTLGDDGLPRAISVPLPLELIKEEK